MDNNTGYYKLNNKVLSFDLDKDINEIKFNHYIMKKENIQRLKGELPRGQFYLSRYDVSTNLNINQSRAKRIIEKFINLGLIVQIKRGRNQNHLSIYQYNSAILCDQPDDQPNEQADDQPNVSEIAVLEGVDEQASDQPNEQANDQYKKELLKRIIKKDIYIQIPDVDNVKINEEQYKKLIDTFTEKLVLENILNLDNYIANGKGGKYKDHYRVLRTWLNKSSKEVSDKNVSSRRNRNFSSDRGRFTKDSEQIEVKLKKSKHRAFSDKEIAELDID